LSKFNLVLLIHGHQPVGNFDAVFEQTYQRSYLPFVDCLTRHPGARMGLHFTGPLLEWFELRHPEFLERLRELASRKQVELVGGGFYEPILVSIPPDDQIEQIHRMRDYLGEKFGEKPSGAWLAERVWEPQVPSILAAAGVTYTLVDDVHFLASGFELDQLHGDYVAEDRGKIVRLLPGLKALRYLLPFGSIEDSLRFLGEAAQRHPGGMAAMGDDCEKFGAWPNTYDHCYRDGWVDRFFSAIEAAHDWLVATPPVEYLATHAPLGRADLPTASYSEMMEWVLPSAARNQFQAVTHEFSGRPEVMRFLRGGPWRGFFTKYAESNLLHKKMLHASEELRRLKSVRLTPEKRAKLARAHTHVLRAQCNDAYWHGVFGGLYAPHLRTEPWRELVRAETLAAEIAPARRGTVCAERSDFDADGNDEIYVTSSRLAALVRPSDGGTICALDYRTTSVTLINSLQRRVETYHSRLREASQAQPGLVASIHDMVRAKEPGLENFLQYDRWPRNAFRLLLFSAAKTFDDYREVRLEENAALAGAPYAILESRPGSVSLACEAPLTGGIAGGASPWLVRCTKTYSFAHQKTGYAIRCATHLNSENASPYHGQVGVEIVLNFLAPDEANRYFETSAGRHPLRWSAATPTLDAGAARLRVVDEWQNVAATIEAPGAAQVWVAPIETVSESEEGFERVYQGSQILFLWPVDLAAGAGWDGEVTLRVEPVRPVTAGALP
jgi:alpha-amylase